ncbi:MAG: hypothetical protein IPL39_24970 [Opitutaceae bacterium]|nr:hypothetical protein [Opitutaceae bacterium]
MNTCVSFSLRCLILAAAVCSNVSAEIIPTARRTAWQPGVDLNGGIPSRTTIYHTLTPRGGTLDDTAAIQTALDDCPANQVVLLGPGTFNITGGGLRMERANITLRGAGPEQTKLVKPRGTQTPVISVGLGVQKGDHVNLAADALKGTNTVTLTGATPSKVAFAPGELVVIDHVTNSESWWNPAPDRSPGGGPEKDPSRGWFSEYDRPIGQVMEIQTISGNTLTFTTSFHMDFRVADQSRLARYWLGDKVKPVTAPTQWSGIEDLYVAYGDGGDSGGNIHLYGAKYCWVRNVESAYSSGGSVNLDGTFRCTVRDSFLHSTIWPYPGGYGYGLVVGYYAADNLVENCISWNFNKVMVMRASGGGNVIGYNYMQDGWGGNYPAMNEVGLNASHYTTPHYELFEGNESYAFSGDSTWGNSIYITAFRNNLTTRRTAAWSFPTFSFSFIDGADVPRTFYFEDAGNRNAVGIATAHLYYNFVGNVLGASDMTLLTNPRSSWTSPQTAFVENYDGQEVHVPMWSLGVDGGTTDAQVRTTALLHGNYDFVTKTIKWDAATPDHALPNSLYLPAKPAFFGATAWPWVTPENSTNPVAGVLPAKARFNTIMSATAAPVIVIDTYDTSVRYGDDVQLIVTAEGNPAPTYAWQTSVDNGATWANMTETASTLRVTATTMLLAAPTPAMTGQRFRCIATNALGSVISGTTILTITPGLPWFGTQPQNASVAAGTTATFTVAATGETAPTYLWQRSTNAGSTWSDLTESATYVGVQTANLGVKTTTAMMTNDRFRCVARNPLGTATSNAATLTVTTGTPGTYAAWRAESFLGPEASNDAVSGPLADPDGAGVTNLQRYAHGLPARGPVANPITLGTATSAGASYLTLSFNRRTTATDLRYVVEASTDLVTWATATTLVPGTPARVTAQDSVAMGAAARRFLRVRVTTVP